MSSAGCLVAALAFALLLAVAAFAWIWLLADTIQP
jgi:hypothetical protein